MTDVSERARPKYNLASRSVPVDCIPPTRRADYYNIRTALHRSYNSRMRRPRRGLSVDACFAEDQLPPEWEGYTALNAAYFPDN